MFIYNAYDATRVYISCMVPKTVGCAGVGGGRDVEEQDDDEEKKNATTHMIIVE